VPDPIIDSHSVDRLIECSWPKLPRGLDHLYDISNILNITSPPYLYRFSEH